jgi:hypothetical protein
MEKDVYLGKRTSEELREVLEWRGKHLWITIAIFQLDDPTLAKQRLGQDNMVGIDHPECWHCDQVWTGADDGLCPGPSIAED